MKKLLRWLLGILLRITLTLLWAALRLTEILFSELAKWLKQYINKVR